MPKTSLSVSWVLENIKCPMRWELIKKIRDWDRRLFDHILRVATLSYAVGNSVYGYKGQDLENLVVGSILHDSGKAAWPQQLITKPNPDELDWQIMKTHPTVGKYFVLESWPSVPEEVLRIVMEHHERIDGSGYPAGIKNVHEMAWIVAAADIFAGMTEPRPYRKKSETVERAAGELVNQKFDLRIVKTIVEVAREVQLEAVVQQEAVSPLWS